MRPLIAIAALTLAGCQLMPPHVEPETGVDAGEAWDARRTHLYGLDAWTLIGRIAVNAQGRGWNGNVLWDQAGEELSIRLMAPMGARTVSIEGRPEWVLIRDSDGGELATADPDNELAHWLGSPLPVASLRWWILGVPDPEHPVVVELDRGGRATGFDQRGWRVTYPRYALHDGEVVPGMVVAESVDSRLRMIIDDWVTVVREDG